MSSTSTASHGDKAINFQPPTGGSVPRYAGMATMMRLPHLELSSLGSVNEVDVGLIGIPWVRTAYIILIEVLGHLLIADYCEYSVHTLRTALSATSILLQDGGTTNRPGAR
jgi:hypothetical protein